MLSLSMSNSPPENPRSCKVMTESSIDTTSPRSPQPTPPTVSSWPISMSFVSIPNYIGVPIEVVPTWITVEGVTSEPQMTWIAVEVASF